MAALPIPIPDVEPCGPPQGGRAMTRCECSGAPFADIARQVEAERRPLGEVLRRTGCGQTCTACLPDLQAFLSSRPSTLG